MPHTPAETINHKQSVTAKLGRLILDFTGQTWMPHSQDSISTSRRQHETTQLPIQLLISSSSSSSSAARTELFITQMRMIYHVIIAVSDFNFCTNIWTKLTLLLTVYFSHGRRNISSVCLHTTHHKPHTHTHTQINNPHFSTNPFCSNKKNNKRIWETSKTEIDIVKKVNIITILQPIYI